MYLNLEDKIKIYIVSLPDDIYRTTQLTGSHISLQHLQFELETVGSICNVPTMSFFSVFNISNVSLEYFLVFVFCLL